MKIESYQQLCMVLGLCLLISCSSKDKTINEVNNENKVKSSSVIEEKVVVYEKRAQEILGKSFLTYLKKIAHSEIETNIIYVYFDQSTCSICLNQALSDINHYFINNQNNVILLPYGYTGIELKALRGIVDEKLKIEDQWITDNAKKTLLSPSFYILNKEGEITMAYNYIAESPEQNINFFKKCLGFINR